MKVGRPGHLPLTIVDMPGLITNDVPEKAIVDQLIKTVLAGSGNADRPLLPIMTGTGTDVDINNLRTNLVRDRNFITVFTHVDHLKEDKVLPTSAPYLALSAGHSKLKTKLLMLCTGHTLNCMTAIYT